jgi:Integrase core domain
VESLGGRVRDELLSVELFSCLTEARVLIEEWRVDYNHHRPHSALGMMTLAVFAASLRPPTATTSGEGDEQRCLLPVVAGAPQPAISPTLQQQSPAEEITSSTRHTNRRGSYRGTTITSTPLSQQVDR